MKHETIRACSIWRALEVVGDVPVLLILEQAFLGKRRFDDFVQETGIARSVISNRPSTLVPGIPTLIAIRTAAPSLLSTHG